MKPLPLQHSDHFLWQDVNDLVTLRHEGTNWQCTLKFSQMQYRLGAGWRDFVVGTKLVKGDAVLFTRTYLRDNSSYYKVKIFKA